MAWTLPKVDDHSNHLKKDYPMGTIRTERREVLRQELLEAGLSLNGEWQPFSVRKVEVGENFLVKFCHTSGQVLLDGEHCDDVEPEMYADVISAWPVIPRPGTYTLSGRAKVLTPQKGKPTVVLEFERFTPETAEHAPHEKSLAVT